MEEDKGIELYDDGIGHVEYVEHMGSDLSIVNSARVSFGKHKEELDAKRDEGNKRATCEAIRGQQAELY